MKRLKFYLCWFVTLYLALNAALYLTQDHFLFFPQKLSSGYSFAFPFNYQEKTFTAKDGTKLHGILAKTDAPKGLVFFLHGNGGSVANWASGAPHYLQHGYDAFYLDYRGYGKSDGRITNEAQLISDAQKIYNAFTDLYSEDTIILAGASMGTGIAVRLAHDNRPKALILNAPYNNLGQLIREKLPFILPWISKYNFESNVYLPDINASVTIFHGTADKIIPYAHAVKLASYNDNAVLIPLEGFGHKGYGSSPVWQSAIQDILRPKTLPAMSD